MDQLFEQDGRICRAMKKRGISLVNEGLKHTYIVHQRWMGRDAHAGSEFNPVDRAIGFRGLGVSTEVRTLLSS